MSTPWFYWLTRLESWLALPGRQPRPRLRPGRSPRPLSRCEALEPRVTPAFFSPTVFAGGVRVASADVNGDLFNDIVAAAGPGGGPHVKVYSGKDGSVVRSFFAYDAGFRGGVYVATGDVNGDGVADIITGAGEGGGPQVNVFSGKDGTLIEKFMVFAPTFAGGVRVAAADVDGDGRADIIAAAGPGGTPQVRVFSGKDGSLLRSFNAYDPAFAGGVFVAAGDLNGDGKADIITGAGAGGGPLVEVFDGATGRGLFGFLAYDAGFHGGVTVGTSTVGGGTQADIVTGAGIGGGPNVKVFAPDGTVLQNFMAYDPSFAGGVNVAVTTPDLNGDGRGDIVTGAGPGGATHIRAFSGANLASLAGFSAFDPVTPAGPFSTQIVLPGDHTPPVIEITDAPPAQITENVVIHGTVTDTGSGPSTLTASVDGGPAQLIPFSLDSGSFSFPTGLPTDGSANGPHTISFVARDVAGNVSQPVTVSFTFTAPNPSNDLTPPVVTITDAPPAQIDTNVVIHGTATDTGSGVAVVTAQLDSRAPETLPLAGDLFAFPTGLPTDGSADGPHTIKFVARDVAGNVSQPVTVTFTLSTQAPAVNFDLAPVYDGTVKGNQRTDLASVTLTGTTLPGATVTLVQTGAQTTAAADGTFSFSGVNLTPGPNTFDVQAKNAQGKTGQLSRVITLNSAPAVTGPVADFQVTAGAADTIINLPAVFSDRDVNSVVHFDTSAGGFDVQLFDQQTPQTVANFLRYLSSGRYANSIFHRTVPNFVVQGGGFTFQGAPPTSSLPAVPTDAPVANEPLLSNQLGTISMAKLGGQPDSATSQFFFNLADNSRGAPQLDTQNGGFTAFGAVLGGGMQTVNQLAAIPTQDRTGGDPNSPFGAIPLQNYPAPPAGNFPADTTAANYALVNNVTVARSPGAGNVDSLTFAVAGNTNPSLVTVAIGTGGRLVLHYVTGQTGTATINLVATDREGDQATTSFTVTVR